MKIINFAFDDNFKYINYPLPAKKYIPDWFKETPKFINTDKEDIIEHMGTFKACMPFTDSLLSGYIFELWQDINIIQDEEMPRINWKDNSVPVFAARDSNLSGNMPIPIGHHDIHFVLRHPLYIKTPPGYSVLITQPLNRNDLPFTALSAIIDCDKEPFFPGNYSMFLRKDFSGVIKAGTPLLQIIPFKRDDWKTKINLNIINEGKKASIKSLRTIRGWYRDNVWSTKKYE